MSDLLQALSGPGLPRLDAILLTLRVASIATAVSFVFCVGLAYLISRRHFPGRGFIDALCTLPMVLPPTVIGYYLLILVGRKGLFGAWLAEQGIQLIFSWHGAVLASTAVISPLIYKTARAAFEGVDQNLEHAARSLGAHEVTVFFRISLPLAKRGIMAGTMLAFARGMGEFGATLMVAGNIPGRTQTLALAIYDAFSAGRDAEAALLVAITSLLCLGILLGADWLLGRARRN
jgi:molybdate transport system permease protein